MPSTTCEIGTGFLPLTSATECEIDGALSDALYGHRARDGRRAKLSTVARRVAETCSTRLSAIRARGLAARYAKRLRRRPHDVAALAKLARRYDDARMRDEAIEAYVRLADANRVAGDFVEVWYCCQRLDALGECHHLPRLYSDLARAYSQAGRHEDAGTACCHAVELYIRDGQVGIARAYARKLPPLGRYEERTREAIKRLIEWSLPGRGTAAESPSRASGADSGTTRSLAGGSASDTRATRMLRSADADFVPHFAEESTQTLDPSRLRAFADAIADGEPAAAEGVFMCGMLGPVTPFDLIQIVEGNGLTARLDVRAPGVSGEIYFEGGQICSASCGWGLEGRAAAKQIVLAEEGAFDVVVLDAVPSDELHGGGSNAALLMDLMREIDEDSRAAEETASNAAAPVRATRPLVFIGDPGLPAESSPFAITDADRQAA